MRRFTALTVVLVALVAFLVGLIIAGEFTPGPVVSTAGGAAPASSRGTRPAGRLPGASVVNFADIAERINAAVVNVDATSSKTAREPRLRRAPEDLDGPRDFES